MAVVNDMAVVAVQEHRHWLSDILLRYHLITEPLPGLKLLDIPQEPVDNSPTLPDEEVDSSYLMSLDPRHWKEQDHYAVLGLKKKRWVASEEDIRRNYRRMILLHHPDKRGHVVDPEQDYFACITKAFEILGDPVKRKSYDSVDPTFDDDIPTVNSSNKKNFYNVYNPVFERNSRWSCIQPVPKLGDENSSLKQVDDFYKFWYNIDSWREYSYQDEEDKERGQDRDERRWIEKENKAIRLKKKKEEMSRIRSLVDNAYACDPRIPKFREQERLQKEEEKRKKQESRKQQKEDEERKQRELEEKERLQQEKYDEEQRAKREIEKKERAAAKRNRKKLRTQIEAVLQQHDYFTTDGNYTKVQALLDSDRLFQSLSLQELEQLIDFFEHNAEATVRKEKFFTLVRTQAGSESTSKGDKIDTANEKADLNSNVSAANSASKKWSTEDCFLLTKAAKIFPPGTQDRWEVITAYFNQHSVSGVARKTREVMSKSKELQDPTSGLRDVSNMNGCSKGENGSKVSAEPSVRDDSVDKCKPWTSEEQKLLEQSLVTFPKDAPRRWDSISESIPGRSKEECMKRFKELAAMVQAKREAQKAASARKT